MPEVQNKDSLSAAVEHLCEEFGVRPERLAHLDPMDHSAIMVRRHVASTFARKMPTNVISKAIHVDSRTINTYYRRYSEAQYRVFEHANGRRFFVEKEEDGYLYGYAVLADGFKGYRENIGITEEYLKEHNFNEVAKNRYVIGQGTEDN